MSWIHTILEEAEAFDLDELLEIEESYDPAKEMLVGPVPLYEKKLFGLAVKYERKSAEFAIEAKYSKSSREMKQRWANMADEYIQKSQKLVDLFWGSIREEYSLWSHSSIGIRKGWIVIKNTDIPPDNASAVFPERTMRKEKQD